MEMTTGLPACFRASNSARICSAAKALPPGCPLQHHGFHLIVTAGLGQQIGKAVAADGAGRLDAIHDGAAGGDEAYLILAALGYCSGMAARYSFQAHALPAVIIGLAHFLDHRLGHFVAGGELIHQTVVEGVAGRIAAGLAQQFEEVILVRRDGIRLDLPLLRHVGHIRLPQLIQPALVRLLALGDISSRV